MTLFLSHYLLVIMGQVKKTKKTVYKMNTLRQKRNRLLKYILLILTILVTSCITKKQLHEQRFLVEKIKPTRAQTNHFKSVFAKWSKLSIPRTDIELQSFDSLTKVGYEIYEELLSDSSFFGIKPAAVHGKYILLPNKLNVGVVDGYKLMFDKFEPIYSGFFLCEIKNFRPKTTLFINPFIYLTDSRLDELTDLYNKYDLTDFFDINLLDNDINSNFVDWTSLRLKYLETSPNITKILWVKNTDEYIVYYRIKSTTIGISIKKINNKWTKIKELERMMVDTTS